MKKKSRMRRTAKRSKGAAAAKRRMRRRTAVAGTVQTAQQESNALTVHHRAGNLAALVESAREDERRHLARELHDELGGSLTALKLELSLLPEQTANGPAFVADKLRSISALIDATVKRVQSIVTGLRPVMLDDEGLIAAIEWQVSDFQQRSGVRCDLRLPAAEFELDRDRSAALFRILQEALTNVARHAQAGTVLVDLRSEGGTVFLTVRDDGRGISREAIHARGSMGLLGIRERAALCGGRVEITAPAEGGTMVVLEIPRTKAPRIKDRRLVRTSVSPARSV